MREPTTNCETNEYGHLQEEAKSILKHLFEEALLSIVLAVPIGRHLSAIKLEYFCVEGVALGTLAIHVGAVNFVKDYLVERVLSGVHVSEVALIHAINQRPKRLH